MCAKNTLSFVEDKVVPMTKKSYQKNANNIKLGGITFAGKINVGEKGGRKGHIIVVG